MGRAFLRSLGVVALVVLGAAAVLGVSPAVRSQQNDAGIVAGLLSRALSTPATRIAIGSVSGALSSNLTLENVTVSDPDGVWVELDKVQLVWTRSALLLGRLEIDRLEVGSLTLHRQPLPTPAREQAAISDEPILPELPVKLNVREFSLERLALGAPVLGTPAQLAASGAMSLGNPAEGLDLKLDARRLDAPGAFAARLAYVPQTDRLDLSLTLDEPAGGLLVTMLDVPESPAVNLDLNGAGTLDSFAARLAFDAGSRIGADGVAELKRDGASRHLSLDLASRIEGLLPPLVAPVFSGTTRLNGNVRFADDGAIGITPLTVASETGRLDVSGTVSSERVADLAIAIRSTAGADAGGDAALGSLMLDATVNGPVAGPRIAAMLAIEDARLPQGRLARLNATFDATPSGDVTDEDAAIPFRADVEANGIEAADPAFARAIGATLSLVAQGTWRDGAAHIAQSHIRTATADARFTGQAGGAALQGRLTLEAPDLARFGAVAGLDLAGRLGLSATFDGVPDEGRVGVVLDGRVDDFATGIEAVDGLAGGTVSLAGAVRQLPDGGFGFQDLRLAGQHATARLHGDVTTERAALEALVSIPQLARADRRLDGRAEARARLTGRLDRLDATSTVDIADARALGRPVPRLTLHLNAADITGLVSADIELDGLVDGKVARGSTRIARRGDGGWQVDGLDAAVGSAAVRGAFALDADSLAQGRVTIAARDLDDLSPLLLMPLAGRLDADAVLTVADGGQGAAVTANGNGLRFGATAVDRLDAQMTFSDIYRRPMLDGQASIDSATIAGEQFSRVRLKAAGTPSASDITLAANARGFALDARARVVPAERIRVELASFTAQRGNRRIALLKPATLTLADEGVDIRALSLSLDRGRLDVDGRIGETLDVTVGARAVPLSITDVLMVDLGLQGTLDAQAKITGTAAAPAGDWQASIARLSSPQTRDLALPAMDIKASGRLAGRQTTIDASVAARGAGTLRLAGTVPFEGAGLDLGVRGRVNLGVVNTHISAAGRRVAGNADADIRIGGSLVQPRVNGGLTLTGGSFSDAAYGLRLTAISGRVAARGEELTIEQLTAQTPDGGRLAVRGRVRIDPAAGFPGSIQLSGERAVLASTSIVKLVASPQLDLSGPLARDPRIGGRIDIHSMDVTVPERLPATSRPLAGTRHVDPPPQVKARQAAEARAKMRAGRSPPFDATLDLTVSAPNRVFVRGQGIDAELGGALRLTGRMASPTTVGAFDLRRGRIQIAGTRLDFTRGRLGFTGDLMPDLDFVAETRAVDVTAQVAVTGRALEPAFAFSASPDLPQDEILSRLLFSRVSGELSPFQALQLAQVAAQLSGGGGNDTFERMRRSLGVDTLDISTSSTGDPTVGASRAINDRVSIGVKAGARTESAGVTVDIDVTRRIRLQGEANGSGGGAVGIGAEWEY